MRVISRTLGVAVLSMAASTVAANGLMTVSESGRRGQAPDIAVGDDGSIHVIWLDKGVTGTADRRGAYTGGGHTHQSFTDLYYARSDDGGATFSAPIQVNAEQGEVWGFSVSKPNIEVGPDGVVHVFYPVNGVSPHNGKDVASSVYTRSTDGGRTFSDALTLNSDPEGDLSEIVSGGIAQAQVFGGMTVSDAGDVYTFWLDTREMNAEDMLSSVYMRASHDNGATFADERRIYLAAACPCCQVTATTGDDNELYMASRIVTGDNIRTPMVAVSRDRGRTFSKRVGVSGTPWQLEGCPLKATALAATGDHLYTLVHNGAEQPPGLLFARSVDGGASFEPAQNIHPAAAVSDFPTLVVAGDALHAVWHGKTDGPRRVFHAVSTDGGESFGEVTELPAPEGAAAYPDAAAMPDGSLIVVWQQGEQILGQRLPASGG